MAQFATYLKQNDVTIPIFMPEMDDHFQLTTHDV